MQKINQIESTQIERINGTNKKRVQNEHIYRV